MLLMVLAMAFILPALHAGCGKAETPAPPVEAPKPPTGDIHGLSADQSRAVAEYGYPDHFFISVDPYSSDRVERWIYFRLGQALDFDNGRLFGKEPVDDQSSQYPPTQLHPQDFNNTMTTAEATSLLGEPLFTHENSDSLLPENTILVYETAVLLFRGEKLMGVDTQVRPPDLPAP